MVKSLDQRVGPVPTADIDVYIPAHVKVVGLDVAAVVIAHHHCSIDFFEEVQCLATEMLLKVVGVDTDTAGSIWLHYFIETAIVFAHSFIVVIDKIDVTLANIEHQRAVILDCKASFDAVLLTNRFDNRGNLSFALLANVGHVSSVLLLYQNYSRLTIFGQPLFFCNITHETP